MHSAHFVRGCWIAFTLLVGFVDWSGQATLAAEKKTEKKPSAIDVVAKTVLYLEFDQQASDIIDINGTKVECDLYLKIPGRDNYVAKRVHTTGTGSLVRSEVLPYVVTARHLVKNTKSIGTYWISPVEGKIQSGTFEDLRRKIPGAKWFFHEHADIAVHPIILAGWGSTFNVAPKNRLSLEPPELLTLVCVPGFPHSLGRDNVELGPLVTTCEIASWPAILPGNPDTKVIFLNARLAKGYSGAPVFSLREPPSRGVLTGHTVRLVGIQSGAYLFKNREPAGTEAIVTQDEVSYIVPVSCLVELLDSKEVQEFEKVLLTKIKAALLKEQSPPKPG